MFFRLLALCGRLRVIPSRAARSIEARAASCCALAGLAVAACQGPSGSEFSGWAQLEQAVIGGRLDDEPRYPGVVAVLPDAPRASFCSGAVIAPNLVLTALHCISPLNDMNFSCSLDGELIQHRPGAGELGAPVAPERIAIYAGLTPDFDNPIAMGLEIVSTNSTQICRNDLALLVLDRDVDLPAMPLRLDEPVVAGEPVTVVGYGHSEEPEVRRHFRSDVRIVDVGQNARGGNGGFAPPRTFVTGTAACPGDSGGPAIAERSPGFPIVGIYSIVSGDCTADGARNVFTQIAPFRELILQAFERSGYEPVAYEPDPPTVDAGTDPGEDGTTDATPTPDPTDESTADDATAAERQRRLRSGCSVNPEQGSTFWSALLLTTLAGLCRVRRGSRRLKSCR